MKEGIDRDAERGILGKGLIRGPILREVSSGMAVTIQIKCLSKNNRGDDGKEMTETLTSEKGASARGRKLYRTSSRGA